MSLLLLYVYAEPLTHPFQKYDGWWQDEKKEDEGDLLWIWEANRESC